MGLGSAVPQRLGGRWVAVITAALTVLAAAITVGVTDLTEGEPAAAIDVIVPGCVVDPADVIAWWKGEDDLVAEIGPDLVGSTGFGAGLIGRAFTPAPGDIATVTAFPQVTAGLSLDAWIRPVQTGATQGIMSRWQAGPSGVGQAYTFMVGPLGDLVFSVNDTSSRFPVTLSASVPALFDGNFHHVAATYDAADGLAIYVDGVQVASRTVQPFSGLNPAAGAAFHLGSRGGGFPYTGPIDEPMVVGRALTPAEVDELFRAGPNGKCTAGPTVTTGFSNLTSAATARWKGQNSGNEIYLGPMTDPSALPRVENGNQWSPGTTFPVSFSYDATAGSVSSTTTGTNGANLTFVFDAGANAPGCPEADWDTLDILVRDSRVDGGLAFTNVELNGIALGDFATPDLAGQPGFQNWTVADYDFTQDFTVTGDIEIVGAFTGNEAMKVQVSVGCMP